MANEPLGFIGLGIMGSRMAANLARAGYDVRVWNRTRETADAWAEEHGGTVADSPARRGRGRHGRHLDGRRRPAGRAGPARRGRRGPRRRARHALRRHVDDRPADARRIGAALDERDLRFVDAPVTGSSPKAEDGTLTIMAGGADRGRRARAALLRGHGRGDPARRRARPRPEGQGHLQRRRRDELRHARPGAGRRQGRGRGPARRSWRSSAPARPTRPWSA